MADERIELEEGKYTVVQHQTGHMEALRHGTPWRDLTGDKLFGSMFAEIQHLQSVVAEVHAWVVCSAITTEGDLAGNLPRIAEITAPEYQGPR